MEKRPKLDERRMILVSALLVACLIACNSEDDGASTPPPPPPPVDAATVPLLHGGNRIGVVFSSPAPAAAAVLNAAFDEAISAGVDTYELVLSWDGIESSPGQIDVAYVSNLFDQFEAAGLDLYLNILTIDTNQLQVPGDFIDPGNSAAFAAGVGFDDPAVLSRLEVMLDAVVPLLVNEGGFYLGVGNEVDSWLSANPGHVDDYLTFVAHARDYVHSIDARMAVGVAVTFNVLQDDPLMFAELKAVSDAIAFTYYPIQGDFSVLNPSVAAADIGDMLDAVAPGPLLIQEIGYPAGWDSGGMLGSSQAMQRDFVQNVFAEIAMEPRMRFTSFLQLADWGPAELDTFQTYYGLADPRFREYLGTLGMREHDDGAEKLAWPAFVNGVSGL